MLSKHQMLELKCSANTRHQRQGAQQTPDASTSHMWTEGASPPAHRTWCLYCTNGKCSRGTGVHGACTGLGKDLVPRAGPTTSQGLTDDANSTTAGTLPRVVTSQDLDKTQRVRP